MNSPYTLVYNARNIPHLRAPRSSMFRRALQSEEQGQVHHGTHSGSHRKRLRRLRSLKVGLRNASSSTSPSWSEDFVRRRLRASSPLDLASRINRAKKYQEYVSNKACFCAFCLIGRLGRFKNHDVQNVVISSSRAYVPMNLLKMFEPPGTAKPTLGTTSIRHVWVVCTRVIIPAAP